MRDWCESACWALVLQTPPRLLSVPFTLYTYIDHGVSTTERSLELGSASSAHPHTCDRHVLSFGPRRKRRDSGGRMLWEHPLPSQSSTRLATDATTHPAPTVPSFLGPDAHTYQNICEYTCRGGTARTCAHTSSPVCADNPAQVGISELPSGHGRHTEPHRPVFPWAYTAHSLTSREDPPSHHP